MTNAEWLLLQVVGDAIVLWICWEGYHFLRSPEVDTHDEHEDVDQVRG